MHIQLFEDWKQSKERMHGAEHEVYPVKHDPSKVFKVGDKDNVLKWTKLFKDHPEIFPVIYKVSPLRQKINTNFTSALAKIDDPYYVELEKLDDKKAREEYENLKSEIYKSDVHTLYGSKFERDDIYLDDVFRDCMKNEIFLKKVENLLKDEPYYQLFLKWSSFLVKVNKIVAPLKQAPGATGTMIDIHSGKNFGYDKSGHLKCLDI
jgi:hypothetical protein